MTVRDFEARLEKLKAEKEQTIAVLNAISGAIKECELWLNVAKAETADEPKTEQNP
jgi:hypothetical protein